MEYMVLFCDYEPYIGVCVFCAAHLTKSESMTKCASRKLLVNVWCRCWKVSIKLRAYNNKKNQENNGHNINKWTHQTQEARKGQRHGIQQQNARAHFPTNRPWALPCSKTKNPSSIATLSTTNRRRPRPTTIQTHGTQVCGSLRITTLWQYGCDNCPIFCSFKKVQHYKFLRPETSLDNGRKWTPPRRSRTCTPVILNFIVSISPFILLSHDIFAQFHRRNLTHVFAQTFCDARIAHIYAEPSNWCSVVARLAFGANYTSNHTSTNATRGTRISWTIYSKPSTSKHVNGWEVFVFCKWREEIYLS